MNHPRLHGLLVLDKPSGLTSRQAVDRVQRWFPRGTRLGHTGTLDPLATGVLVLCVGNATRLTEYVQQMTKTYHAGVRLGARSDTDDADGRLEPVADPRPPDVGTLSRCLQQFVGVIDQVPPAYSAVRIAGQRAHQLARRGQDLALQARSVRIYSIELVAYQYPDLRLIVRCGKGTYIRSLARDLGDRLGCGAYLTALRRTQVGSFTVAAAVPLDADAAAARAALLPVAAAVADLPGLTLAAADVRRLRQGQVVLQTSFAGPAGEVAVFDETGGLVGIAVWEPGRRQLRAAKILSM